MPPVRNAAQATVARRVARSVANNFMPLLSFIREDPVEPLLIGRGGCGFRRTIINPLHATACPYDGRESDFACGNSFGSVSILKKITAAEFGGEFDNNGIGEETGKIDREALPKTRRHSQRHWISHGQTVKYSRNGGVVRNKVFKRKNTRFTRKEVLNIHGAECARRESHRGLPVKQNDLICPRVHIGDENRNFNVRHHKHRWIAYCDLMFKKA